MFEVKVVGGETGFGRTIWFADSYTEAKMEAERLSPHWHYGVVIVDTARGIADWGDWGGQWTTTTDTSTAIEPPEYAI